MESNRPIVVLVLDRILQRLSLGVALNARVIRTDEIELGRVDDIQTRRICGMLAAGSVTSLTSDVPFRYGLRPDIVIDRMAAVAQRTSRSLVVVGRIEGHPPIRIWLNEI